MRKAIFILLALLIFSLNASALGVVSDYLENNTLILAEDSSKLYGIRLQNPTSEELYIKLTYDDTIAKIIDYQEIYSIPKKDSKSIFFNISAPSNFKQDSNYLVSYTVHQLSGSGSGVPILLKINKNFNVKVIKNPNKSDTRNNSNINYYYAVYGAIALVLLLYIFRKKIINYLEKTKIVQKKALDIEK